MFESDLKCLKEAATASITGRRNRKAVICFVVRIGVRWCFDLKDSDGAVVIAHRIQMIAVFPLSYSINTAAIRAYHHIHYAVDAVHTVHPVPLDIHKGERAGGGIAFKVSDHPVIIPGGLDVGAV